MRDTRNASRILVGNPNERNLVWENNIKLNLLRNRVVGYGLITCVAGKKQVAGSYEHRD
jgi:hypothetical protein